MEVKSRENETVLYFPIIFKLILIEFFFQIYSHKDQLKNKKKNIMKFINNNFIFVAKVKKKKSSFLAPVKMKRSESIANLASDTI